MELAEGGGATADGASAVRRLLVETLAARRPRRARGVARRRVARARRTGRAARDRLGAPADADTKPARTRHGPVRQSPATVDRMDEARRVLERLARIEALDRAKAAPGELLDELRELVREAEDWTRAEGGDADADAAVRRLRASLAHDMIGV